jgi:hypothetical protein
VRSSVDLDLASEVPPEKANEAASVISVAYASAFLPYLISATLHKVLHNVRR